MESSKENMHFFIRASRVKNAKADIYQFILISTVYCPIAFTSMFTRTNVIHRLKDNIHTAQHNNQHQRKIVLLTFHLNDHSSGIHPRTQKLEPHCTA